MLAEKSIFKAYDVRGKYPSELNEEVAFKIAAAVGNYFLSKSRSANRRAYRQAGKVRVVIGRDGRLSSPTLYNAVLRGLRHPYKLENVRMKIIEAGTMTTPILYFLVNKLKADGGIMVTASHNPKEYNGLKVVGSKAKPISGKEVYKLVLASPAFLSAPAFADSNGRRRLRLAAISTPQRGADRANRGSVVAVRNAGKSSTFLYANFLKKFLRPKRKLKIIFDCSNGVTSLVLKKLFRKSNVKGQMLKVIPVFINDKVDGNFPAHGSNPLVKGATRQLEQEVKKQKADLGIIFDGDGDRVFFIDNRGRWVDPNESAYILTKLFKPPYVVGIVSSWRLKKLTAKSYKLKAILISRVGHYFFKKLMREKKASLGLEHSGHYYFQKFFYCDSGILAAIEVINFVSGLKTDFASWLDNLPKYYRSGELNFKVRDKEKVLAKIEKIYKKAATKISKLDGLTMEFKNYWFNVRPSNTEPLLRLNLEAINKNILRKELQNLRNLI